ncbi:MAG: hypothetical protein GXO33_07885 [Epsilonproteobacteria bacterium]|nr:hypothetical protein [Campylobacterota bacterium]
MTIKKKNYLLCLFIGIAMGIWMIADFIYYDTFDYHAKFGVWLFFISFALFGLPCLGYYFDSLEKAHTLDIKEGTLLFDNTKHPIDNPVTFKLTYSDANAIQVSLYIGDKPVFKHITFNADEFDALMQLLRPYLKYPKIAENINFHTLKLFEDGFFVGKKKFYYEKIEKIEAFEHINRDGIKTLKLHITTKNGSYEKTLLQVDQANVEVLVRNFASYMEHIGEKIYLRHSETS